MIGRRADASDRMPFLTLLRAAACLSVVFFHLGGNFLDARHATWWPVTVLRTVIFTPLGLTDNTAYWGVMVFFLVSGYIITHVARRENRTAFATKRVLRIAPPLIVAALVAYTLHLVGLFDARDVWTFGQVVSAATLWTNLTADLVAHAILAVSWTLVIECLFYLLTWALLPLLQRRPDVALIAFPATFWLLSIALDEAARLPALPVSLQRLPSYLAFVPCLFIGQAIYGVTRRLIQPATFVALVLLDGVAFVVAYVRFDQRTPLDAFLIALAWALPVFVVALAGNAWLRLPRIVALLGDCSYSLYLLHVPVGMAVLALLYRHRAALGGFTLPFVAAVAASIAVALISWLVVERPSQHLARWLLKHWPDRSARRAQHEQPAQMEPSVLY